MTAFSESKMVGVGRIELPTPAMSTQPQRAKSADFRQFGLAEFQLIAALTGEIDPFTPQSHRSGGAR